MTSGLASCSLPVPEEVLAMDETAELFELVEVVTDLQPEHRRQVLWLARTFAEWELREARPGQG